MKPRAALQSKDEQRSSRTLYAWDLLIGVQDLTRQGVLRLRRPGTEAFLGDEKMAAPPVTTLRELRPWPTSSAIGVLTIWMHYENDSPCLSHPARL